MTNSHRIATIIQRADKPLSTNAAADTAGIEWHTANDRLETLKAQNRVHRKQLSDRLTLWWDQPIPL